MKQLIASNLLLAWAILSVATVLSWWLDGAFISDAVVATGQGRWVGTAILAIAFFKARLVLLQFMQVKAAPSAVRWCCEAWVVMACALLIGMYWLAPA